MGEAMKISKRFGTTLVWMRKIGNNYYRFYVGYDTGLIQVYRAEYDPERWEDVWVLKHTWEINNAEI
jgi:hypothetical protein